MQNSFKDITAIFFIILFMAVISAPTIIISFDESVDVSSFYSINEEEENENLKLVVEKEFQVLEALYEDQLDNIIIGYTFKNYPVPHLNLISPPPDFNS